MSVKILITGGCGYVGSRVAKILSDKKYEVIVVDKISPKERNINFPKNVDFRRADLTIKEEAEKSIYGADYILHLAADIGPLEYMEKYQSDILRQNSLIDSNVYPLAVKNNCKGIIYSSSSMVFQHPVKFPYTEEEISKINPPTNVYGFSKLIGEFFCKAYHNQYGLNYIILRYHNIYGPGEDSKGSSSGDIHVIPALLEKVLVKNQYPIELLGDPESTRPFVYVDDAVEATVMILEKMVKGDKRVINNDFNIVSDNHITIKELAETIWKIFGDGRKFEYKRIETKAITSIRREADPSKIRSIIGWKPKIDLNTGIMKTAEWIKSKNNIKDL